MAENEASKTTGAAIEDQEQGNAAVPTGGEADQEALFQYPIQIEDAGPATKKVTIEIPQDRIADKLAEQFKELRQEAVIPGFRPGHAPQKLIEKRFNTDVREQVRRSLISESYQQAVEQNSLEVLGEPEFDNPDEIKLPEAGPLNYSFQIEVQPEIQLPELTGLKVKKPKIEIKQENIDQAMNNLRQQQGALVPIEDRGVQEGDYLTADVHVRQEGNVVLHQHDARIVSRPGRIAGIQIEDLAKQLEGLKPSETRTIAATASDSHPNEAIRGKSVEIEIVLKDIKHLELAEMNKDFLDDLGFASEQEVRDALREQMVERIEEDVQRSMREQVNKYLLESVTIDLPAKLSDRQIERAVQRKKIDLMIRGTPQEQVEADIEQIRAGTKEEALNELKLFFILQKIATERNVDVDEAELNGRVALLAMQRGRRPEKMKQEMSKDGSLANLYIQMREQKAVDQILESAEIEEVDLPQSQE